MGYLSDYLSNFKNKRVAVIGAGVSNTPLINVLLEAGFETTIRDKRSRDEVDETVLSFEQRGAILKLDEDYLCGLDEDIIFRTPGLMPTNPALVEAVERGAVLTSEMEVFFEICPCKIIAVTGSDGKTTTTSVIGEMLKNEGKTVHVGGNIGTPLLCKADEMLPDDIAVLELSSFQLITMKKSPDIAVVTNLSPNHLDIHKDMEEYKEAKSNIFMFQKQTDRVVFNLDNEVTREYAKSAPAGEVLFFSRIEKVENGVYCENGTIFESIDGNAAKIMEAKDIILLGVHNIENYMAACAAVKGLVSYETMRETAKSFGGVEHRIELVRELRGVKYYNDSIASSPSRAIAGIRALSDHAGEHGRIILVAGGKDKGVAFDGFGAEVVDKVNTIVLTGVAADQIHQAIIKVGQGALEIHRCKEFAEAVIKASELAKEGDIVTLCPACTSFDMFRNFEERGKTFKDIVNSLV